MKQHKLRKAAALLLAMALALLCGCGGESGSKTLRVDLTGSIKTLDAQLADTPLALCLLQNSMEGLLRQLPDGTLTEGVATDFTVSSDGLVYTFTLRQDAVWSDGTPLTADDFLFAMQRIFGGEAGAAPVQELLAIQNGWAVYQGLMGLSSLGVTAADEHTLVFHLAETDPLFPEKLAQSYAFPCNREFFAGTHARYGNTLDYILFNGPFTISSWSSDTVKLTANARYTGTSPAQCPGITCYLNRAEALDAFIKGETDFYPVDYATAITLPTATTQLITFQNGMVDLIFNRGENVLTANLYLRRALCLSVEMLDFVENGRLPEHYRYTSSLVPDSAELYDESYHDLMNRGFLLGEIPGDAEEGQGAPGQSYRHSNQIGFSYSVSAAKSALLDSDLSEVTGLSILLPQDSDLLEFAGWLQKQWYDHLRIIVNLEAVPEEEYTARLKSGDYTMAIASYTAGSDPDTVFRAFLTGSAPAYFPSTRLQQLLELAETAPNVEEAIRYYANAEALLLDNAVVMPLFSASSYYAMGKGVTGIEISSDGSNIFFAGAARK